MVGSESESMTADIRRRICVMTGTRAEFGLLEPLMESLASHPRFELQVLATGSHLSRELGYTIEEVESKFKVDAKVDLDLSSDSPLGVAHSMGLGLEGFVGAFEDLGPDLLILVGDRYEALAVALAATLVRLPIAHIHGGETTEGAMDEVFRHSITKMSHLHFTATEDYRQRVIQLGESPERVHHVGGLGVDVLSRIKLMGQEDLEKELGMKLDKFFLITFHPVTLEGSTSKEQVGALLAALDGFEDYSLVFTKANSDTEGKVINRLLEEFVSQRNNAILVSSLGMYRYASLLSLASGVVGNSSSGLLEAPFFGTPTLDIGDRQKGRLAGASVHQVTADEQTIEDGLKTILSQKFKEHCIPEGNPYGLGGASKRILDIIDGQETLPSLKKVFYDLPFQSN